MFTMQRLLYILDVFLVSNRPTVINKQWFENNSKFQNMFGANDMFYSVFRNTTLVL